MVPGSLTSASPMDDYCESDGDSDSGDSPENFVTDTTTEENEQHQTTGKIFKGSESELKKLKKFIFPKN